jgi:hypothetical protein
VVADTTGTAVVNRDPTTELLIGGGALLLAAAGGVFLWRYWQGRASDEEEWEEAPAAPLVNSAEADSLLRAIADLDNAYESGGIEESAYQAQRAELKRKLTAIWGK